MTKKIFPEAALMQHVAVLGKTGSGKTSTAKLAIEQVVGFSNQESGYRVCVLDPIKSDWYGITSNADGTRAGLPFAILGGPHGHLPLSPDAGAAIGELVGAGRDLPLSILDMADFPAGGVQRFFVDFADTLIKRMKGVLYLVLEEAHEFAPKERSGFDKELQSIHFAKKLATAGRSKGIRMIVVTQRTQALHNAVLGSCDTMIAHRFTAPADQEPIVKWLKANTPKEVAAEVAGSLSSLKTGTAWFCSGEASIFERREFPRIRTFDNSATPTVDSTGAPAIKSAAVDLEALRAIVGAALQEADANDPKLLRVRIQTLERDLARSRPASLEESMTRGAEVRQLREAEQAAREKNAKLMKWIDELEDRLARMNPLLGDLRDVLDKVVAYLTIQTTKAFDVLPDPVELLPIHKAPPAPSSGAIARAGNGAGVGLPKAETAILRALYWLRSEERTPEKVAFYAGYSVSSSSYTNALGALRSAGLVVSWAITPDGKRRIEDVAGEKPTGRELREWIRGKLPKAENAVLDVLVSRRGERCSNAELAAHSGYSEASSSFTNAIGKLRSIGAAQGYERDGGTRAAEIFL